MKLRRRRAESSLLLAEDSPTIRGLIAQNLRTAGFTDLTAVEDGSRAWSEIERRLSDPDVEQFGLIISDIEMPKLDGLTLTRRIEEHRELSHMPVVIFSSLVSMDNLKKCEAVGADAQITKPELGKLVDLIDSLLAKSAAAPKKAPVAAAARPPISAEAVGVGV